MTSISLCSVVSVLYLVVMSLLYEPLDGLVIACFIIVRLAQTSKVESKYEVLVEVVDLVVPVPELGFVHINCALL